jgi:hypothetical protein
MAPRRPTGTKQQEEVMGKAVPEQHPAVVLRSHYNHLRALLIAALIAVLGLAGAVVIVANDDDTVVSTSTPAIEYGGTGATGTPDTAPAPRYDGGPNEGSADITPGVNLPARPNQAQAFPGTAQQAEASVSRHDIRMDLRRLRAGGVTSQGSADVTTAKPGVMPQTGSPRYDGGPNEGSADIQFRGSKASATPQTDSPRYDGGPNEGSADVTSKSGDKASVMPQTDGFRYQP